jgi:hypothetical protein
LTGAQRADVEAWAIHDLWAATGNVYGTCDVTVMPCNDWGVLCGGCWNAYRSCGCITVPEVKLPGPVASVSEVVIDGAALDPSAYRVDDYQWLVRTDGDYWPTNTDYLDPDAFSVTYALGIEPPAGAGYVTGLLVCARACTNSGCKIPREAQTVTRQGVTMVRGTLTGTSSRPWRYYPDTVGIFGILDVDAWVRNVSAPVAAGAVHSPDMPTVRQITWQASSP